MKHIIFLVFILCANQQGFGQEQASTTASLQLVKNTFEDELALSTNQHHI
ncbi:MAG: hypothetical protein H7Y13_08740 [Sphingobacteriaceae bacterium]|nr:hypothetical protein [Sphingobacteriaceae bacterium]